MYWCNQETNFAFPNKLWLLICTVYLYTCLYITCICVYIFLFVLCPGICFSTCTSRISGIFLVCLHDFGLNPISLLHSSVCGVLCVFRTAKNSRLTCLDRTAWAFCRDTQDLCSQVACALPCEATGSKSKFCFIFFVYWRKKNLLFFKWALL